MHSSQLPREVCSLGGKKAAVAHDESNTTTAAQQQQQQHSSSSSSSTAAAAAAAARRWSAAAAAAAAFSLQLLSMAKGVHACTAPNSTVNLHPGNTSRHIIYASPVSIKQTFSLRHFVIFLYATA